MGPDASTLYGRHSTIRTIRTTAQKQAVQSDVALSGSYVERRFELGKLMLYQLSYSRSQANEDTTSPDRLPGRRHAVNSRAT
jgi:hypothetical protein